MSAYLLKHIFIRYLGYLIYTSGSSGYLPSMLLTLPHHCGRVFGSNVKLKLYKTYCIKLGSWQFEHVLLESFTPPSLCPSRLLGPASRFVQDGS